MMEQTEKKKRWWLNLSLGTLIIIGAVLGVGTGLFFGESCRGFAVAGQAFIGLLQMCVLPYILLSLIYGIGSLQYSQARQLALKGTIALVIFWLAAFVFIYLSSFCFPDWKASSFFSSGLVAPPPEINYMEIYIPANPFSSLSKNMVPAVTLFGISVGIALISMDNKDNLLDVTGVLVTAMGKVTNSIVKLTPLGTFAITASVAGTMTPEAFGRMQIYIIIYIVIALLFTFCVIPLVCKMFTPFKYRDILGCSKDALITGFMTGNLFILLPMMTESTKKLFADYGLQNEETEGMPGIIIPIAYNFPSIGKLMSMFFIVFAAWYCGSPLKTGQYPGFLISGLMSLFGSSTLAVPFMLDMFQLPSDLFELYMTGGIIVGKFATMIAFIHLFCLTLICTFFMTAAKKDIFKIHRLVAALIIIGLVTIAIIPITRIILEKSFSKDDSHAEQLKSMKLRNPVKYTLLTEPSKGNPGVKNSSLAAIRKRKLLRVGYVPNKLPFTYITYINKEPHPAGFDFAMLNMLAKGLNWELELIPVEHGNMIDALNRGVIDIGAGALKMSLKTLGRVNFTDSYLELNLALVVKDFDKDNFPPEDLTKHVKQLKVAIMRNSRYIPMIKKKSSGIEVVEVDDYIDFFTGKVQARGLVVSAEAGAAWTIIYPSFTTIIPKPVIHRDLIGYAVARKNYELLTFLNLWLRLMEINGHQKKFYDYWIEGKSEKIKERWNIMNDVLKLNQKTKSVEYED
jgi:Na+/H+-dicarboxylate symporter/ABC-type amino acid transport substrate-binding protein